VTAFELAYLCAEPLLPPLYARVRRTLVAFARSEPRRPRILDVGGRRSHYTIGVPADIVLTDLPRQSEVQHRLDLGVTDGMFQRTLARRSNVVEALYDDMTCSRLESASFDAVVAVEVLEHVKEDDRFVSEVYRVLRPGGRFVMTTPNGDALRTVSGDHVRHYTREGLYRTLAGHFECVQVAYAIRGGRLRRLGLQPWSLAHPARTLLSMGANLVAAIQPAQAATTNDARGTRNLIAVARKL
jgi:SAM-dependent methyltransferase